METEMNAILLILGCEPHFYLIYTTKTTSVARSNKKYQPHLPHFIVREMR